MDKVNEFIKNYMKSKDFNEYNKIVGHCIGIFGFSRGKAMEYISKAADFDCHSEEELYYIIANMRLQEIKNTESD